MKLTESEIASVCRLVNEMAGIQWDASKTYLIESRLPSLLRDHHCTDLSDLVSKVRANINPQIRADFVDAITTRETLFFRDESPFDALRHKALPEIIDAKSKGTWAKRLRLWSAACSSGQEPYSLGIVLRELIDDIDDWDVQIMATDLSSAALATASKGVYSDFEMSRGIDARRRDKYFHKVPGGWKICDEVRSMVSFSQRNLLEPFTNIGPFDVIFCRNVAIYFDAPVKKKLFERLAEVLTQNGALFVGSSESLSAFGDRWKPLHHCRGIFYLPNRDCLGPIASVAATSPTRPTTATTAPRSMTAGGKPAPTPVPAATRPAAATVTPPRPATPVKAPSPPPTVATKPATPVPAKPVAAAPLAPKPLPSPAAAKPAAPALPTAAPRATVPPKPAAVAPKPHTPLPAVQRPLATAVKR